MRMLCMKKVLFTLLLLSFGISLSAQVPSELSESGARSWKAAVALLDMAKSTDDLDGPIKEFEKVTVSDPNFPDTYFNLGKLYTRYGKEKGPKYLDKARSFYENYIRLRPDDRKNAEDEISVLDALRESALNALPPKEKAEWCFSQFQGTWVGSGLKVTFSNLITYEDSRFVGLGRCSVYSHNDNGVNSALWDTYSEAVREHRTSRSTITANLRENGKEVFWFGSVNYNSRSSVNRYLLTDYLFGKFRLDTDTHLTKYYTATVRNGVLYIQCKTTYSDFIVDNQGYGRVGRERKSESQTFTLYKE